MATITFTISTNDLTRIVNALSVRFGYQAILPGGGANPQTPAEFVRLQIGQWAATETMNHELAQAKSALTATTVSIT